LLRRERFRKAIHYLNGRILDYGCGTGGLANYVPPERYRGVEPDPLSLQQAQSRFPDHRFSPPPPDESERFESVIALAVVEHVRDTVEFLHRLATYLSDSPDARLIITTQHPSLRFIYTVGSNLGLFSKHAYEEHIQLLDYAKMKAAGSSAGLELVFYQRFLLGANQLAVFKKVG
jgi:2-polyprenyl-3-methyl-5-hydroxy-6-metoxy-1,4-benzoquinol methylase